MSALRAAVDELDYRWRRVLVLRYGLDGAPTRTLDEIGQVFARTRERIRQIQEQALQALIEADTPAATSARDLARVLADDDGQLWRHLDAYQRLTDCQLIHELVLRLAGLPREKAGRRARAQLAAVKLQLLARDPRQPPGAFQAFFDQTLWPRTVRWPPPPARPVRDVLVSADSLASGWFRSDKLDRNVTFESGIELALLRQLEASRDVTDYVEQPVEIPYALSGGARHYVPDVLVTLADGRSVLIEIKPRQHFGELPNLVKWAAAARWCGQHGVGLLIGDGRHVAWPALTASVDPGLRARILAALDDGALNWSRYQEVAGPDTPLDALVALAAAEPLDWRLRPFHLCHPDASDAAEVRALIRLLHARAV